MAGRVIIWFFKCTLWLFLPHADVAIVEFLIKVAVQKGVWIGLAALFVLGQTLQGALGGNDWRLSLLLDDCLPVYPTEERVLLDLAGATLFL